MKYGLQPTTEETGVRPLLEIKRGFAALEYSRCCLPLDTTQAHKYVSDTASESHRRSPFLFDLAAGQGLGTRLEEKKARCCHVKRCRSQFVPPWYRLLNLQTKRHREKEKEKKKNSNSLPTCLIFQGHNYFPRTGKGTQQKYPPKGMNVISPKGFLTRKQDFFHTKNAHGSPQKPFSCGSLVFPAVYQLIRHTLL